MPEFASKNHDQIYQFTHKYMCLIMIFISNADGF